MSERSVSITGATGFLGWHLSEAFLAAGWKVTAVVRPGSQKPTPPGVLRVEAPLESGGVSGLAKAFEGASVVIHGAAVTRARSAREFEVNNVEGTGAVVRAMEPTGARLILLSSQAAAGPGTVAAPTREVDEPRPVNAYGRSKLAAELVVREAKVPWTILRLCSIYGPRDRGFLPLFRLASNGIFVRAASRESAYTILHVDDVRRAILLAADSDRAGDQVMFIGHPTPCTEERLLELLAEAYGRRYAPIQLPLWLLRGAGMAGDVMWKFGASPLVDSARVAELSRPGFVCAVDRAQDVLGYSATVRIEDGLRATAAWYRDQGWI